MYKYGGQRNYGCITTQVDLVIVLIQISVDTLDSDSSNSRTTAAPRGGRTGGRTGRGGGRTGDQDGQRGDRGVEANRGIDEVPDFSTIIAQQLQNLFPAIITQVGNHSNNQGNNGNRNGNVVNDNIRDDVRNVIVNNGRDGCSYKNFMACNPKDFDGRGGAIAYTRWIEKMELFQDMSGCGANQKVKYCSILDIITQSRE
ncbi:hypothetical protein Tco_1336109 [Tanacetum coccineum]